MSKQIVWSPSAESDFANILEYLQENWEERVTNQFIDLTESILTQISTNPRQFPLIHKKQKNQKVRHNKA
jgi:plasmid stabilization system protein ParE